MGFTASDLHVIAVITNPARYRRRYELYREFAHRMKESGATLWTVEHAFGARDHAVTLDADPHVIQVRGSDEMWHKENLFNIGLSRLPANAQYVASVDADFTFSRPDWVMETLHQLQHTPVVQMFSEIQNLNHKGELVHHGPPTLSFVESWRRGFQLKTFKGTAKGDLYFHPNKPPHQNVPAYPGEGGQTWLGSPGGAWAYRRDALSVLGGLLDFSVVGSGDYLMAAALFGFVELIIQDGHHQTFVEDVKHWQARALQLRKNIGIVPGLVLHHWHGPMSQRGYGERWRILTKHQFNPRTDLKKDWQGLLSLNDDGSDRMRALRDDLRSYLSSRNEDSI